MGALIHRDIVIIWRTSAFWIAAAAQILVLTGFVVIWGDGIPVVNQGTSWEQFAATQQALLVVMLPWVAVRCSRRPQHETTMLAIAAGRPASAVMLARCVAAAAALSALVLSAMPICLVMADIAGVPVTAAVLAVVPLIALAALVAAVTIASTLACSTPLGACVVSTIMVGLWAAAAPLSPAAAPMSALAAFGTGVVVRRLTDRTAMYLPEEAA